MPEYDSNPGQPEDVIQLIIAGSHSRMDETLDSTKEVFWLDKNAGQILIFEREDRFLALDELQHPEFILEAYSEDYQQNQLLSEAKYQLLFNERARTQNLIRANIRNALQCLITGKYKFGGEVFGQSFIDVMGNMHCIHSIDRKSNGLKYSALRLIQNQTLLRLTGSKVAKDFITSGIRPTVNNTILFMSLNDYNFDPYLIRMRDLYESFVITQQEARAKLINSQLAVIDHIVPAYIREYSEELATKVQITSEL
jgi:hypothetical protein